MATIVNVKAREIIDSRGNPTIEADVRLDSGTVGRASVPSGASTGAHEAIEKRDRDSARHGGYGVTGVIRSGLPAILEGLKGIDASDQRTVDAAMRMLDGTDNKSRLGANLILAVSLANARAAGNEAGVPLYAWISRLAGHNRQPLIPTPMINILSGGLHARQNIDMQDFQVMPMSAPTYAEGLEWVCRVYRVARQVLEEQGMTTLLADEGGYGPALPSNEAALELLTRIVERSGFRPLEDIAITVDVASSHFWQEDGFYRLAGEGRTLDAAGLTGLLKSWVGKYPIVSLEDGLAEDDWTGWPEHTRELGTIQLIGDDLFVTNPERLARGIETGAANSVLVKMNQIGSLTETLDVVAQAKAAGYRTVISARSGETEDAFLADLAVGCRGGQIKVGSVARSSRLAKYNQLLRIEEELGSSATYLAGAVLTESGY